MNDAEGRIMSLILQKICLVKMDLKTFCLKYNHTCM